MNLDILRKIQEQGLLPLLMQHGAQEKPPPGAPGAGGPPVTAKPEARLPMPGPSQQTPSAPPPQASAPPQANAPLEGGGVGPQVKYDPSGAGASLPPPIAQPYEAVQSVHQLLTGWSERKHKKEEAEAANIAQNLMQALKNKDTATVHDILNDQHSKKILDKVYKGWLTKMEEQQKPGKEPDPTVSGFESGLKTFTDKTNQEAQAKQPPSQPPGSTGGVRLPQGSPQDQFSAAKLSAETQAAQQDPNRLLSSQLTSSEMRETELGAGPEKVRAEIAKAGAEVKKAQIELEKLDIELKMKQETAASSKERGDIAVKREHERYLTALVNLDIAKQRFRNTVQLKAGKQKMLPIADRVKITAVEKAMNIVESVQKEGRSFAVSDITSLSNELKSAGATELVKRLPTEYTAWLHGKGTVEDFAKALKVYQEGLKKSFDDGYPGWDGKAVAPDKKAADQPGDIPPGDDEVDDVDADIIINPEDMEKPPN